MTPGTITAGPMSGGDAAKLMLLERVGRAVGDEVLSHLQPILLIYELLRAGLARPDADVEALRQTTEWIKPAVLGAMRAGAAAAEWLLPSGANTPSTELAAECIALLRPELELCGLRIELASEGDPLPLDRAQARTMFCAVLTHAADQEAEGPQDILVQLGHRDGVCAVRISRRPLADAAAADFLRPRPGPLAWSDLLLLAEREGARVRREDDGTIVLELMIAGLRAP